MFQIGTDVMEVAKETDIQQPHLLLLVPVGSPQEIFVVFDHVVIHGGSSIIEAFDLLYKLFYVFDIEHPKILEDFYVFLTSYFYKMKVKSTLRPQVRALACSLMIYISNVGYNI